MPTIDREANNTIAFAVVVNVARVKTKVGPEILERSRGIGERRTSLSFELIMCLFTRYVSIRLHARGTPHDCIYMRTCLRNNTVQQ